MSLGYVVPNNGAVTRRIMVLPSQVKTNYDSLSKNLVAQLLESPQGETIVRHFLKQKPGWWKSVLTNNNLSIESKFKKIFGVSIYDAFPSTKLLGNIFEDIGNWFSGGGAERLANEIERTAGEISKVLNALRNKPEYNYAQQQQIQDFQSKTFWGIQDIISQYGWLIIGGLIVFLLVRK